MKSATLKIEGMHCEGCAATIKALLTTEQGVHAAEVSFKSGQARVLFDPKAVGEDQLVRVIEGGGFRVPSRTA